MLNTKEHFNQLEVDTIQQEPLFTDLTFEGAAVVEGGKSFSNNIFFDNSTSTRTFSGVKSGGIIQLSTNTSNYGFGKNPTFNAILRNLTTGKAYPRVLKVGEATATWTNIAGGKNRYAIRFTDSKDGIYVGGSIGVYYS